MMRRFFSLVELEEMGYTILVEKDIPGIEKHLAEECSLNVTDDLRIETEDGIYLAEVAYEEQ